MKPIISYTTKPVVSSEKLRASDIPRGLNVDDLSTDLCSTLPQLPIIPCESCKKLDHEVNHPIGMIFVGWGLGWQSCPHCDGTGVVEVGGDKCIK